MNERDRMLKELLAMSPQMIEETGSPLEAALRETLARFDLPHAIKQTALAAVLAESIASDPLTTGDIMSKLAMTHAACTMLNQLVANEIGKP